MKKKRLLFIFAFILIFPITLFFLFPGIIGDSLLALHRKSANLSNKQIQVGDHYISYLEGGSGPAILMLHGFGANKDNWIRFAKILTPTYRVIAIDIPGFGDSSKIIAASYDIPSQTRRLKELVDRLELGVFHLVGHSMGGEIAGKFAADHPLQVKSLTLIGTAGLKCPKKSKLELMIESGSNPFMINTVEDFDNLLKLEFVVDPQIPTFIKKLIAEKAIASASFTRKTFEDSVENDTYWLQSDLERISSKTLVIWGDSDNNQDLSCVDILREKLLNPKIALIHECGHLPMIERPEETASLYLTFLTE